MNSQHIWLGGGHVIHTILAQRSVQKSSPAVQSSDPVHNPVQQLETSKLYTQHVHHEYYNIYLYLMCEPTHYFMGIVYQPLQPLISAVILTYGFFLIWKMSATNHTFVHCSQTQWHVNDNLP